MLVDREVKLDSFELDTVLYALQRYRKYCFERLEETHDAIWALQLSRINITLHRLYAKAGYPDTLEEDV